MSGKMPRGFGLIVGVSLACITLFSAGGAKADLVMMDYIGPGGNNSGGIYTYPYIFSIDSSTSNYSLMCDDFNHEISGGNTWEANTLDVPDLNATNVLQLQYPSAGVTGYLEASYLFEEEASNYTASNSDPEGLYNWAVWDLLGNSDVSAAHLSAGDETQVQTYLSAAEAAGSGLTPADFQGVEIYTPTDMSGGGPQEFFGLDTPTGIVPEPCTLALVGVSAIGLLGRRRRTVR